MLGPKTTCILKSPVNTVDSQGSSYPSSWTTVKTFKGVFQPLSAAEKVAYDRETAILMHYLFVDYSVAENVISSFIEPNRIYIGSTAYNITGVENFHNHHLEITLKRIV